METELNIIYDGADVEVTYRDGTQKTLHLRLLKISEIEKYLDLSISDEAAGLKLCIEGDEDIDNLTFESFDALLLKNHDLNFHAALAAMKAKQARAQRTGAGMAEILKGAQSLLEKFAPLLPSQAATPAAK